MELREPQPTETDRIREVVDSSMTTSFRLSPERIDAISEHQFSDDVIEDALADDDAVLRVVEVDADGQHRIAGVVHATVGDGRGTLDWLFVDPEHRGDGIGTELFETATEELEGRGVEDVLVRVLEKNSEGPEFAERFGFERAGERRLEYGDVTVSEYVYAPTDADVELESETEPEHSELFPETVIVDGRITATTDDGERMFLAQNEEESGTQAAFYVAYTDESNDERFGFYCSNCGSLDTAMNEMDRIECATCGNTHASKSRKAYDESFL